MYVGYINVTSKLTRSDRQYLSHNIMNYIVKLCFLLNIAKPVVQYITPFFIGLCYNEFQTLNPFVKYLCIMFQFKSI